MARGSLIYLTGEKFRDIPMVTYMIYCTGSNVLDLPNG